ncbi:DoxX family protein [Streptomyces sp. NPDC091292]|uniref:DoxX family protein n=1 Tax=Streptomyces sp. NPDC091292 TaxID=3365991 RepID=UPI00382F1B4A
MSETTVETAGTAATVDTAANGTARSAARSGTRRAGRRADIALRSLQVLLALFYVIASAVPKLIAHSSAVESFDKMGWGRPGMYTVGVLELLGGVALVIPALVSVAAIALSLLMVGAFITQVTVFDGENAATPLILIVPLALIAWARRHRTGELLRLVRQRA